MDLPKVTFIKNIETETQRIFNLAKEIECGFFWNEGFCISEAIIQEYPQVIVFPNFDYKKIKGFWKTVSSLKNNKVNYTNLPDELFSKVSSKIEFNEKKAEEDINKFQEQYDKVEEKLWQKILQFYPKASAYEAIEVRISDYGTRSSWQLIDSLDSGVNHIVYIRSDATIESLVRAIVSPLHRLKGWEKKNTWKESQAIIDTILYETSLGQLHRKKASTRDLLTSIPDKVRQASNNYYKQLGFCFSHNTLTTDSGYVYYNGKNISYELLAVEQRILALLIEHKNNVISYDQIADTIWTNDDDYSLWAIQKTVQRLREKLALLDVMDFQIRTARKKGYILK